MSWSGGIVNRRWNQAAGRENIGRLTREQEHALYLAKRDERFYCDSCGGFHTLREAC